MSYTDQYKSDMTDIAKIYFGRISDENMVHLNNALDFSINKRYREVRVELDNNYTNEIRRTTLRQMADYINDKKPIMTSYGTLFMRHGTVPNPLAEVIQSFLDRRGEYKKKMFQYPKGSAEFEYYNLMQSLEKINCNSIYGTLGNYTSLLYNRNVATSITAAGRSFISIAGMFLEQFLGNSVKFSSLDEVLMFVKHTVSERSKRKYRDIDILSHWISPEECFARLVLDCGGYGNNIYIPTNDELDILWKVVNNLPQEDLNRVYYKNNLYEFLSNVSMQKAIRIMMSTLTRPFLTPDDIPEEIRAQLDVFVELCDEYVVNHFQVMDRIIRWQIMTHEVCVISDTDSAFISLEPWVRFVNCTIAGMRLPIAEISMDMVKSLEEERLTFYKENPTVLDYDFFNDQIVERKRAIDPLIVIPQDNVRYSIISIMTHVVSLLCNKYIEDSTKTSNSWAPDKKCKMYLKNEFLMKRILMTTVKKNYASLQELQEGNVIEHDIKSALDVKGIECLTKSTKSESTRAALRKILYEDILDAEEIDQVRVIKDMAILEKTIMKSLQEGSKEYYTPATVKSIDTYANPMQIQGVKAILTWNALREEGDHPIDINARNAVSIAKVLITPYTMDNEIRERNPRLYMAIKKYMEEYAEFYKDKKITSVAIPLDQEVPQWVIDILDYNTLISDNISGFPLESINIRRSNNDSINYSNMVKL